jgi:hypothetical protein
MPSSTSNSERTNVATAAAAVGDFERPIPELPWTAIVTSVVLLTLALGTAWELRARAHGYRPTLNDTFDLWAEQRRAVKPDSIVIIGDSRPFFDLDLDRLEAGLGKRPIQLALPGSCAYPVLADLANDPAFHGTIICSVVPAMYFAPGGPLLQNSESALKRYHNQTWSQRISQTLSERLEAEIACLKEDDLTLSALLGSLPIPDRPGALIPPKLPPYFSSLDADRRARMFEACAQPGPLQDRVKFGWIPLFTPPPPPTYVPREAYAAGVGKAIEARFTDTVAAVEKLRARGGRIVFVRFPVSGALKQLEDKATPKAGPWTRLLKMTNVPGIYFEDYPELAGFQCPEWSHLSAADSVVFTERLVPHLREALASAK